MMEFYYFKDELEYGKLSTYSLPTMVCLMGEIISFWMKQFNDGILLFLKWAFIFHIMDLCFAHDGMSYGEDNPILGSII